MSGYVMDFKTAQKLAKQERRGAGAANHLAGGVRDLLVGLFHWVIAAIAAVAVADAVLTVMHHHHEGVSVGAGFFVLASVYGLLDVRANRGLDQRAAEIAAAAELARGD